jgi:hypothetical protein
MDKQYVSMFADSLRVMLEGAQAQDNGKKGIHNAWHGFCHALVQTADLVDGVDSELARLNVEAAYKALHKLTGVDMGKNSTPRVYKKIIIDALAQNVALYEEQDDGEAQVRDLSDVKKDMRKQGSDASRIREQLERIIKMMGREAGCEGTADEWHAVYTMTQTIYLKAHAAGDFESTVERMAA